MPPRTLRPGPEELRRALTWAQGRETARWAAFENLSGIAVYFAEPHSPWLRPSSDASNGLLRRWLRKSRDLSAYDQDDLDSISRQINTMPRRSPQCETAYDCYRGSAVALTG